MMRSRASRLLALAAGAAMLISSTVVTASPAPPPPTSAAPANPWVTLSMLNPAGAAALGGATAVAQPDYPPPQGAAGIGGIPWPVIAVWLAVIALDIYLLVNDDNDEQEFASPD